MTSIGSNQPINPVGSTMSPFARNLHRTFRYLGMAGVSSWRAMRAAGAGAWAGMQSYWPSVRQGFGTGYGWAAENAARAWGGYRGLMATGPGMPPDAGTLQRMGSWLTAADVTSRRAAALGARLGTLAAGTAAMGGLGYLGYRLMRD